MKLLSKIFLFSIFLTPSFCFAKQFKTYPSAATTEVRWQTYIDDFATISNSTCTIDFSTWTELSDGSYWIQPSTATIDTWKWDYIASTYNYIPMDLNAYTSKVVETVRLRDIFDNIAGNMEEYMIYPGTNAPEGWKGWCLQVINGNDVPVSCP